jgi:hypothetical protein
MDEKRYSLNDIFGYLREATLLLSKDVTISSENDSGQVAKAHMLLSEYIAMSLASELISDTSRMASEDSIAKKDDVIAAMKANYYDEIAFPNYEGVGLLLTGGSSSRSKKANGSSSRSKTKKLRR